MGLATVDDLSNTVVSDGPRGEKGVLASTLKLGDDQVAEAKAGHFTVAISLGWLGDDWASEQTKELKENFEKLGIKVVAETNASWDDAKQISDLDAIAVLKPNLLVSIPLNGQTTAAAYEKIADTGTKMVFIDQAEDGMDPGTDYASIISSDDLALGVYVADLLAKAVGGKGDVGAMALLGETAPPYVVVPPPAVDRANLAQAHQTIYRMPLPAQMVADLKR